MKQYLLTTLMLSILLSPSVATANWMGKLIAERETKGFVSHKSPAKESSFFSTHALVLFYASTCPHCHRFAPVLKRWAVQQGADILALSFDNQPLPEFPQFNEATTAWVNAAFQGQAITYPALFIVNQQNHALYPVAMGSLTDVELDRRLTMLLPKIQAYEQQGSRV